MKKKFLIPLLAVFTMIIVFAFSNVSKSSEAQNINNMFVESDNIAYAETGVCRYRANWVCYSAGVYTYNMELICY